MVGQPETPTYDPTVYEWEVTDPVQGGLNGVANLPLLNLSNRTAYLKQRLDSLISGALIPPTIAPLNGPAFTGSVTAPNVRPGDNSTLIANTNFVQTARSGASVVIVGANLGTSVTLTQDQWGAGIIVFSGTLVADYSVIFPNRGGAWIVSNQTTGFFNLTCKTAAGFGVVILPAPHQFTTLWCDSVSIWPQVSVDVHADFGTGLTNPGSLNMFGNISGNALFMAAGIFGLNSNVTQNMAAATATVTTGGRGTGDVHRVVTMGDFITTHSSGFSLINLPDGTIIQSVLGTTNAGGREFTLFPFTFPSNCVSVAVTEAAPAGWGSALTNINPTVFGVNALLNGGFTMYSAVWDSGLKQWNYGSPIAYHYIAIGY